ncbi:MAG: amidohydrolase [Flavobacteriales bacterium]|nr:amidohydrolase [Flavobacteriales bacterium]
MLKIDMHTHILPERLPRFADKFGYGDFIHLQPREDGAADMMKGDTYFRTIQPNCWDPDLRIGEYAENLTQVQVVCTIPVMFSYWAKGKDCLELSQFLNDDIAKLVEKHPKHYIGLGTIPMQDTDLAIQELRRLKEELNIPGIQIGSNINDLNLNEERFFPIFEACQELDLAIMVHPWNMMGMESMPKYWLPWLVGMPGETSRAMCSMIFGGIFERLPNLRVCFSHAGGSFFGTIGRIEHGYNCRPDLVAIDNDHNPRNYIGKFWVDCITHDAKALETILDYQGSKRVCLGSDYPFPLGDLEIGKFITEMGLPNEAVEDIFCNSTLEWLKLEKAAYLMD